MGGTGRRVAIALAAGIAAVAAWHWGGAWLNLTAVQEHRAVLEAWVAERYLTAAALAIVIYAAATALSIPGGVVLSLTVGWLFGRWTGTALIVAGATLGAAGVFLAARYLVADAVRARLDHHERARQLMHGFSRDAWSYLLFLRLVPLFPFWLVNLVPAFTPTPLRTYVAATALGIVPGAFVYANLGGTLGEVGSLGGLMSVPVLAALAALGVFALAPLAWRRWRAGAG